MPHRQLRGRRPRRCPSWRPRWHSRWQQNAAQALLGSVSLTAVVVAAALAGCGPEDDSPRGIYRDQCARCHGLDGAGNPRAVDTKPGLNLKESELVASLDREAIRRHIVEGKGTMPAYGEKLTPEEIDAMVELSIQLGLGSSAPAAPEGNGELGGGGENGE